MVAALPPLGGSPEQPTYRITITFGHTTAAGRPVAPAAIDAARRQLTITLNAVCGGARIDRHGGSYRTGDGADIDERATSISAIGIGLDVPLATVTAAARRAARLLEQESVLLVVERLTGSMFFVPPD